MKTPHMVLLKQFYNTGHHRLPGYHGMVHMKEMNQVVLRSSQRGRR